MAQDVVKVTLKPETCFLFNFGEGTFHGIPRTVKNVLFCEISYLLCNERGYSFGGLTPAAFMASNVENVVGFSRRVTLA